MVRSRCDCWCFPWMESTTTTIRKRHSKQDNEVKLTLLSALFVVALATTTNASALEVRNVTPITVTINEPVSYESCVVRGHERRNPTSTGAAIGGILGGALSDDSRGVVVGTIIGGMIGSEISERDYSPSRECEIRHTHRQVTQNRYQVLFCDAQNICFETITTRSFRRGEIVHYSIE